MTGEVFFIQRVVSRVGDVTQSDAVLSHWMTVLRWWKMNIIITQNEKKRYVYFSCFSPPLYLYILQKHKYISHHVSQWLKLRHRESRGSVSLPWRCRDGCRGYPVLCKVAGTRRHRPRRPCRLSSAGESKTCCLTDWAGRPETGVGSDGSVAQTQYWIMFTQYQWGVWPSFSAI